MFFKNCPLCNEELQEMIGLKNIITLYCNNKSCKIPLVNNRGIGLTEFHSDFECGIIAGLYIINYYSLNIKVKDKIYNLISDQKSKNTSLYEWHFEYDVIELSDFWLNDDPIISVDEFIEPGDTKEFYIDLAHKLINLNAFS